MERFTSLVFIAGLGCFALAFVLSLVFPAITLGQYHDMEYKTLEQLAATPSEEFVGLAERYPEAFRAAYGEVSPESYARALRTGRDLYVGQACWHCHSQYIREVSNEAQRFGPPSRPQDYQNELNQPHLWGTRRVGPDLSREKGKRSNDWHVAHFLQPLNVVPESVMPAYPYYFDEAGVPDERGIALITYVQWLGTEAAPEEMR